MRTYIIQFQNIRTSPFFLSHPEVHQFDFRSYKIRAFVSDDSHCEMGHVNLKKFILCRNGISSFQSNLNLRRYE